MKTISQAGQDIFVRLILGDNHKGTFVDIGCANDQYSNTLALEESGWTGLLFDLNPQAATNRKSPFVCCDATKTKFELPPYVDYLSLDIDEGTLEALKNIDFAKTKFGIITVEHDAYQRGDRLRLPIRKHLIEQGYKIICQDVCGSPNMPFEEWAVSPQLEAKAKKFVSDGLFYQDILKR